jgi:hypothetical protein
VDLDETFYGGEDIEDDLDTAQFDSVASTTSKSWTFKLLRWEQLLN